MLSAEHFVMPNDCLAMSVPRPMLRLDSPQILPLLQKLGQRVRILLIVRRQEDWLESWYQERIKRYETRTYQDVSRASDFGPILQLPCYDRVVGNLAERFGQENIFVVPFEFLRADPPRFFGTVGEAIGVPVSDLQLPVMKGRIKPATLKPDAGATSCWLLSLVSQGADGFRSIAVQDVQENLCLRLPVRAASYWQV